MLAARAADDCCAPAFQVHRVTEQLRLALLFSHHYGITLYQITSNFVFYFYSDLGNTP